jgi:cytosine/adenosine deaminase-related metal-dependent hydrolase
VHEAAYEPNEQVPKEVLTARQMLVAATLDGAFVAGVEDRTGSLTPGKQADVVVIDGKSLNMAPIIDPVAAVVLCADVSNVDTVLVAGEYKKRDGKLLADVDKVRADVEASRDYLVSAVSKSTPA